MVLGKGNVVKVTEDERRIEQLKAQGFIEHAVEALEDGEEKPKDDEEKPEDDEEKPEDGEAGGETEKPKAKARNQK